MEFNNPDKINEDIFKQITDLYLKQIKIIDKFTLYLNNILCVEDRILLFENLANDLNEFNNSENRFFFTEYKNFTSLWIGLLYIYNIDIIKKIERIMISLGDYMSFKNIIQLSKNYPPNFIDYVISGMHMDDALIIKWYRSQKANINILEQFKINYYSIKQKCNKIIDFYIERKSIQQFKKMITSIKFLKEIFPIEIVEKIIFINKLSLDYCVFKFFLKNKRDLEIIISQTNTNDLKKIIYFYLKNKKDIVGTILDINYN